MKFKTQTVLHLYFTDIKDSSRHKGQVQLTLDDFNEPEQTEPRNYLAIYHCSNGEDYIIQPKQNNHG